MPETVLAGDCACQRLRLSGPAGAPARVPPVTRADAVPHAPLLLRRRTPLSCVDANPQGEPDDIPGWVRRT